MVDKCINCKKVVNHIPGKTNIIGVLAKTIALLPKVVFVFGTRVPVIGIFISLTALLFMPLALCAIIFNFLFGWILPKHIRYYSCPLCGHIFFTGEYC